MRHVEDENHDASIRAGNKRISDPASHYTSFRLMSGMKPIMVILARCNKGVEQRPLFLLLSNSSKEVSEQFPSNS